MILTYTGNPKFLNNKEIKELIDNPLINGINRSELSTIFAKRIKWNIIAKDRILNEKIREYESINYEI